MIPLGPRILVSPDSGSWAGFAAEAIELEISSVLSCKNVCCMMLTGGNTVQSLYEKWASLSTFPFSRLSFLFGDERCVPPDHVDSNYSLVMKALLAKGIPPGCSIARMEAENPDREAAARAYEELIPEKVDVLLLGMGEDGHIASLFPYGFSLQEDRRKVVPVKGPKLPYERLTITGKVIANARAVFLLARGAEKGRVLAEALNLETDSHSLPVRLTMRGTWLLDPEAGDIVLKDSN
jgi:6-phosphogluconolactonase